MNIRSLSFLFATALIAACASTIPGKVYQARSAYDAAVLTPLASYASLPVCTGTGTVCHKPDLLAKLAKDDGNVRTMFLSASSASLAASDPTGNASTLLADAITAGNAVIQELNDNGLATGLKPIPAP